MQLVHRGDWLLHRNYVYSRVSLSILDPGALNAGALLLASTMRFDLPSAGGRRCRPWLPAALLTMHSVPWKTCRAARYVHFPLSTFRFPVSSLFPSPLSVCCWMKRPRKSCQEESLRGITATRSAVDSRGKKRAVAGLVSRCANKVASLPSFSLSSIPKIFPCGWSSAVSDVSSLSTVLQITNLICLALRPSKPSANQGVICHVLRQPPLHDKPRCEEFCDGLPSVGESGVHANGVCVNRSRETAKRPKSQTMWRC